jgi:hypothetical protein
VLRGPTSCLRNAHATAQHCTKPSGAVGTNMGCIGMTYRTIIWVAGHWTQHGSCSHRTCYSAAPCGSYHAAGVNPRPPQSAAGRARVHLSHGSQQEGVLQSQLLQVPGSCKVAPLFLQGQQDGAIPLLRASRGTHPQLLNSSSTQQGAALNPTILYPIAVVDGSTCATLRPAQQLQPPQPARSWRTQAGVGCNVMKAAHVYAPHNHSTDPFHVGTFCLAGHIGVCRIRTQPASIG